MSRRGKYIFVTVGTTEFFPLIETVASAEFIDIAERLGFDSILMQVGRMKVESIPKIAQPVTDSKDCSSSFVRFFGTKPSLQEDIQAAGLVISHAGAGTIVETLLAGKPLIVVSNSTLMNNHQLELAEEMARLGYLWHAHEPNELLSILSMNWGKTTLKPYPYGRTPSNEAFDSFLDSLVAQQQQVKTMVVLGSGGHTAEMFRMLRSWDKERYRPRQYVVAASDTNSVSKISVAEGGSNPTHTVIRIPRSREVHQSYFTSIFTTLWAFFWSIILVFKVRPDLVRAIHAAVGSAPQLLCNGPGTCVPLAVAALLLRLLCIKKVRVIYVESIARVHSLSLSGRLLYRIADYFLVQWPQLRAANLYPRSVYLGMVV